MARFCLAIALFALAIAPALASAPFGNHTNQVPLSQALATLSAGARPTTGLVLVINAENRQPPAPGARNQQSAVIPYPPYATQSIPGLAAIYDLTEQTFGRVTALGPAKMRLMNPDPAPLPFSLGGLSRSDALRLLIGSLSDSQLQKMGTSGIGLTDLDQEQQQLFGAVFSELLQVAPASANFPTLRDKYLTENPSDPDGASDKAHADIEAQIQTVSLPSIAGITLTCHLSATYFLTVPGPGFHSILVPLHEYDPKPGTDYHEQESDDRPPNPMANYFVQDLPNTLKPSDLNWNARALGAVVLLDGAKTAGDIVARAAKATGLDLYCDPRYAHESATFLGDISRPVPASDLLMALCVCVTGTFRQVGPAFVLTDDPAGVIGTREKNRAIGNGLNAEMQNLGKQADERFDKTDWLADLSFAPDDPDALPNGMIAQYLPTSATSDDEAISIPLGQLPGSIQQGLKDYVTGKPTPDYLPPDSYKDVADALTPDYKTHVYIGTEFLANIPGLGTVALEDITNWINLRLDNMVVGKTAKAPESIGTKVKITAAMRGALCAPKTAGEARKIVDKLAAIGMNTLYCEIFTGGKAYCPNPAVPPASADAAAVLNAAVDEGRDRGVRVIAVVDTLCWRRGNSIDLAHDPLPPGAGQDLAATGETSLQATNRLVADGNGMWPSFDSADTQPAPVQEEVWMDPGDPVVQGDLAAIVRSAASVPHLAGIAFLDTAGPGYTDSYFHGTELDLGYTPEARLAFLRQTGADAIDVESSASLDLATYGTILYGGELVNLDLPEFDDGDWDRTGSLSDAWSKMLVGIDLDLLGKLWSATKSPNLDLPLYVQDRRYGNTIAPWADPKHPSEPAAVSDPSSYYTSQIPDELSAGDALVIPYSDLRQNPDHWCGETQPKDRTPWNGTVQDDADALTASHGRGGIIFDLVDDPSSDGPVRDLTVIGEHVAFMPAGR